MSKGLVYIGLINPKSPDNVGAVLRAAGCFSVDKVLYTGQRYATAAAFRTDTKDIVRQIPLLGVDTLPEQLMPGMQLVCVELVEGAIPLPAFVHPAQAMYVFGPEDGSIDQALIDRADAVVYLPTRGCLNLAATVNVALYDRLAKTAGSTGGDALIRQSRDRNNRLRWRGEA
ncbi:MAG: RNA methyltransferase [Chromatiales bacterium]|nr:RNA methyltransferase [Gammaproteobacteria bacterium]MBW6476802.1 RNA methyltransferase [Chromatiales bacterium]